MSERVTITDLGTEFGLSHQRCRAILQDAGVPRDARKLFDSDDARSALNAAIDPAMRLGNRMAGRGASVDVPHVAALAAAKTASEEQRTLKLKIENELKAGKLVPVDTVKEAGATFAAHVRDGILGLAPRIAARLAEKSAADVLSILDSELRRVLADLSDIDTYVLGDA